MKAKSTGERLTLSALGVPLATMRDRNDGVTLTVTTAIDAVMVVEPELFCAVNL